MIGLSIAHGCAVIAVSWSVCTVLVLWFLHRATREVGPR